jgi:hypothetical protein
MLQSCLIWTALRYIVPSFPLCSSAPLRYLWVKSSSALFSVPSVSYVMESSSSSLPFATRRSRAFRGEGGRLTPVPT